MRGCLSKQSHHSEKKVILIAGPDDQGYGHTLSLSFKDCDVIGKQNIQEAKRYYLTHRVDIAVLSNIPAIPCLSLLKFLKNIKPHVNIIILTRNGSEEFAVDAFRKGATDYFSASFELKELETRIGCLLISEEVKNRRRSDYGLDNFRTAVNYASEHYNERIELRCVAHLAGMSLSCFQRSFKKKMGVTFTEYVNNLRISRAKKMLENSNLSISEIAFMNGFSNQYHFTRTFKKISNICPSLYRNSLKS